MVDLRKQPPSDEGPHNGPAASDHPPTSYPPPPPPIPPALPQQSRQALPYPQQPAPYFRQGAAYPPPPAPYTFPAGAPYGVDPLTGVPFSDKTKLVAGLLQILLPLGIGRMYMGHTGIGVTQLLVTIFTCGIGGLWPFIDGIVLLAGNPRDANGRPMRMS